MIAWKQRRELREARKQLEEDFFFPNKDVHNPIF